MKEIDEELSTVMKRLTESLLILHEKGMDEELSTADPLAPNGSLLPNGTGNGLLKPCLQYSAG